MRKDLVVILILALGGILIAYRWSGESPLSAFNARGVVNTDNATFPAQMASGAEGAHASAKLKTKPGTGRSGSASLEKAASPVPPASEVTRQQSVEIELCCAHPDFPFPAPEMLRRGSTVAQIRSEYGAPNMDVVGSRDGRVLEKYYYVNKDRSRLTIATIENGTLVSSQSLSSPYFQFPNPGVLQDSQPVRIGP